MTGKQYIPLKDREKIIEDMERTQRFVAEHGLDGNKVPFVGGHSWTVEEAMREYMVVPKNANGFNVASSPGMSECACVSEDEFGVPCPKCGALYCRECAG